jgi:5-methyltetrahydropteroyltriglutamate--homocysteine methyltransferase
MSESSSSHIRVDHIGSLMRPPAVQQAMLDFMRGRSSEAQIESVENSAIRDVLAQQEAHGLPVVTDGEFRRRTYLDSLGQSVSGLEGWRRTWAERFLQEFESRDTAPSGAQSLAADRQVAQQPIRLTRNLPLAEYRFAAPLTTRTLKITLLSPFHAAQFVATDGEDSAYQSFGDLLDDLVAAEHQIVEELGAAGCTYIQQDAASYVGFLDPRYRQSTAGSAQEIDSRVQQAISAENRAIEGVEGVTFGLHICRGNRPGTPPGEGAYDPIAERVFNSAKHDRLLLEYDTERAGGFEPLRFVPKNKVAVLGLVSTKSARVETVDELKRKLDEASRYLPIEQLAISPQCGFSSNVWGPPMTVDDQWRKLDVLLQVASDVWGEAAGTG